MDNSSFCHLHVHTQYSYLDGYGSAKQYAKYAKELGFTALACTDHGNIDGLIDFQRQCKAAEIDPILGCEAYIVPDLRTKDKGEKRNHVTLLVKNQKGFENLCRMLSVANIEGYYKRPRIDFKLLRKHYEGLVILSGCSASFLSAKGGEGLFDYLYDKIGDDLYFEIMPHDFDGQYVMNDLVSKLSEDYSDLKFVATNDCHYIEKADWEIQEVLLAVQTKAIWDDPKRFKFSFHGLHLRTADEMVTTFKRMEKPFRKNFRKAIENTMEVADKCKNFTIEKKQIFLPNVPGHETDASVFLLEKIDERLKKFRKAGWPSKKIARYKKRAEEEWELIQEKGFIPYFMIIYELINWCKENGIMVGPARGSAGGCLVAYLLGITTVDPIRFNLLFSRFISEDRTDLPDVDIDFEDKKRDAVRMHLEELYGVDNISSISTFLTMKSKMAVRDVCRVFNIDSREVDEFAKTINPFAEVDEDLIVEAIKEDPGKTFYKKYKKQVDMAIKLEGQVRGVGQHAAGIIVSGENLTSGKRGNICMRQATPAINWSMADVEHMGLMKLDVLGLNTLTILNETIRLIKENKDKAFYYHPESECYLVCDKDDVADDLVEVDFDFEKIPLDDERVFDDISKGNTVGVFQLNPYTTTKRVKEIQCHNIQGLSDIIALVRPGPNLSGMTDQYIENKRGGWDDRITNEYDKIVNETYGIVVYQEQVMEVIYKVAGLPYALADKIRKVISKKRDPKEFEPFKKQFLRGCVKEKIFSRQEGLEFWEMLQSHARYSFNKSHSTAYAILAYWTAYAKYYFPAEFICANLSFGADDKKEELIKEAYRLGLKLVLPRPGISDPLKWSVKKGKLYIPLLEVKGIGETTAQKVHEEYAAKKEHKKEKRVFVQGFFSGKKEVGKNANKESKSDRILKTIERLEDEGDYRELSNFFTFTIQGR